MCHLRVGGGVCKSKFKRDVRKTSVKLTHFGWDILVWREGEGKGGGLSPSKIENARGTLILKDP